MTLPPLLAIAKGRQVPSAQGRGPARRKEIELHMAVADVLRRFAKPEWRWSHFPSGELRDKRTARKASNPWDYSRDGLDFVILDPCGPLHALELEAAWAKSLNGNQEDFRDWCASHQVPHAVAWTSDDALKVLIRWGGVLRIKMATRSGEGARRRERVPGLSSIAFGFNSMPLPMRLGPNLRNPPNDRPRPGSPRARPLARRCGCGWAGVLQRD